tara:strand:- start:37231 stop:37425 length:195 start_codon:yes stop_codon:yes gene_type:complete
MKKYGYKEAKVLEADSFWKYHIYGKKFGIWWKIGGRDTLSSARSMATGALKPDNCVLHIKSEEK